MVKKTIKLIGINVLVLFCLLICINLLLILAVEARSGINKLFITFSINSKRVDSRAYLPNYKNISWAKKHFQEFHQLPTEYKSYIGWRRLPYQGETINIESNGIRYTPQSEFVNDSSLLVVFMGGSTMWGTGANDETTIPAFFSEISRGQYRTLNFGETGYRAFQDFIFLKQQFHKGLYPRIVISYSGYNESVGFRSELSAISHTREYQIRSVMQGQDTKRSDNLTFRNFFLGAIEDFIPKLQGKLKLQQQNDKRYDLSGERTKQVAKALLDSWMSTKSLVEENGALYIAILHPVAGVGSPKTDHLKIDQERIKMFSQLYPMILSLLSTTQYESLANNVIDLSGIFDREEHIYINFLHVSPNGNKIVAQAIYDYVKKNLQEN